MQLVVSSDADFTVTVDISRVPVKALAGAITKTCATKLLTSKIDVVTTPTTSIAVTLFASLVRMLGTAKPVLHDSMPTTSFRHTTWNSVWNGSGYFGLCSNLLLQSKMRV